MLSAVNTHNSCRAWPSCTAEELLTWYAAKRSFSDSGSLILRCRTIQDIAARNTLWDETPHGRIYYFIDFELSRQFPSTEKAPVVERQSAPGSLGNADFVDPFAVDIIALGETFHHILRTVEEDDMPFKRTPEVGLIPHTWPLTDMS